MDHPVGPHHRARRARRPDFACRLTYDADGLIADYPGIATRVQ